MIAILLFLRFLCFANQLTSFFAELVNESSAAKFFMEKNQHGGGNRRACQNCDNRGNRSICALLLLLVVASTATTVMNLSFDIMSCAILARQFPADGVPRYFLFDGDSAECTLSAPAPIFSPQQVTIRVGQYSAKINVTAAKGSPSAAIRGIPRASRDRVVRAGSVKTPLCWCTAFCHMCL